LYGGEAALAAKVRPTVKNFANSRHQAKRRPFGRPRNLSPKAAKVLSTVPIAEAAGAPASTGATLSSKTTIGA
jgi:hypothetical protein